MTRYLLALVAVLNGAMLPAAPLSADQVRVGEIAIEKPWARASIGTSRPAVAYFTVRNLGSEPDRLMSVTSPASGMAEIHATTQENGVMRMRPAGPQDRSEEHTSELQSLMRISSAVFCLKNKTTKKSKTSSKY